GAWGYNPWAWGGYYQPYYGGYYGGYYGNVYYGNTYYYRSNRIQPGMRPGSNLAFSNGNVRGRSVRNGNAFANGNTGVRPVRNGNQNIRTGNEEIRSNQPSIRPVRTEQPVRNNNTISTNET